MQQNVLDRSTGTEGKIRLPTDHMATPFLFKLLEPAPEVAPLDITNTGAPTDVPPREIWDMDYDS